MADDRKRRTPEDPPRGRTDEPQSYGSDKDWLHGTTAQTVEGTPHRTARHDEAFYEPSLDANLSSAAEAADAPVQRNHDTPQSGSPSRATGPTSLGGKKVAESNATRQSFFRKRDYD